MNPSKPRPGYPFRAATPRPRTSGARLLVVLLCGAWLLPAYAVKGGDPYLQAINAEGNRLEFLGKAQEEHKALLRQQAQMKSGGAPVAAAPAAAATGVHGFEDALRGSFPGSYALYSLMGPKDKELVYAEYLKRNVDGPARFIPVVVKIIAVTNAKGHETRNSPKNP